ncbi:MAG: serine/threonine-protein kinase [Chthoniobacterales bacterium]
MTGSDWQRVKVVLADVLEEPPENRSAFLARSCGGDTTLMREVSALLAEDTQVLEDCAVGRNITRDEGRIDQRVGAYTIVRELGRGGMGAVYLAARADGEFEKQVAIKLLKRGTDTDEVLRRFRAERRIVARLDHANIARLLDAGTTDDGLPYFVMEYVEGESITEYARTRQISIRERLALFLKVCSAVETAHESQIIHRDLKPSNILVRPDGEPKLLDFGIAKLLAAAEDAVLVTMTEQRRLTPACASPEQARGEAVTPASDVYALGALLYELLTEKSPHRFASAQPTPEEITRVVCELEPVRPSLAVDGAPRRRELRGDLETIALTALRKEPARRYASVAAFAEDIQRHLDRRPVHARPHTTVYLARRYITRNRVALAVAGALTIATVGVGSTMIWQVSRSAAHSAALRAEVKDALETYQNDWHRGNPVGALNDAGRAITALKELHETQPSDPNVAEAEGYAEQCLAVAQRARGDLPAAAQSYREAEELYRSLAVAHPATALYAESARAMERERAQVEAAGSPGQ